MAKSWRTVLIDRLLFILGETLIALRRNLSLGLAAMTTLAIALYVLAGMFYVADRASTYAEFVQGRFEMTVNLKEGTDRAGIQRTAKYLRLLPGVAHVVLVPKENLWRKYQQENPELTSGYSAEDNIFPDSFRVRLNDLGKGDAVAATARRMSTVDQKGGVEYFRDAQNNVALWLRVARNLAYPIGALLLAVAGIVVFNAIRLTVESHRVEIRIMRLVGATRSVVSLPFVLEGAFHGAVGGALATAGLLASHRAVAAKLAELSVGASLAPFPTSFYLIALCAVGGGYGGLCSLLALRAPWRAR